MPTLKERHDAAADLILSAPSLAWAQGLVDDNHDIDLDQLKLAARMSSDGVLWLVGLVCWLVDPSNHLPPLRDAACISTADRAVVRDLGVDW